MAYVKTAKEGYVLLRLFQTNGIAGLPTGKIRTKPDGKVEAEFISLSRASNCWKLWACKEDLIV